MDGHPEVITALERCRMRARLWAEWVGNVVGAVQGLLLGSTKLANGNTLQHLVDEATGNLVDKTLSAVRLSTLRKIRSTQRFGMSSTRSYFGYSRDRCVPPTIG